jgi:hypothetical protein
MHENQSKLRKNSKRERRKLTKTQKKPKSDLAYHETTTVPCIRCRT